MTRFALHHRVPRVQRDPTIYDVGYDDELEVFRIADVLAELSTASPWDQDLVDHESGRTWTRRFGSTWSLADSA